ncbi:hypothetical protein ACJIZ3_011941 [Penstemon smallii]|uniref:Uncharacterized protein n=1 Tax=Penstemon smallii TaxID=265156 RepID=A0ABD3UKJ9_9LAMI
MSTIFNYTTRFPHEWKQNTGRKSSALCGAALYVSSLAHGLKFSIIKVVHICEATITKRLIEFENTESGGLNDIEEFNVKAQEFEKERLNKPLNTGSKASGISELLCEHSGSGKPPFAHGLCKNCYTDSIKLSGGLDGGLEPPSFQRAEMERIMAKEAVEQNTENLDSSMLHNLAENSDKQSSVNIVTEYKDLQEESDLKGASLQHNNVHDSSNCRTPEVDATFKKSESLSDIDDTEVCYLLNEEEKELKDIIWGEMNKEYIEEQAAKEAAAAVAKSKKVSFATFLINSSKATKQMLEKKRLSSRIRYDLLDKLSDESVHCYLNISLNLRPEIPTKKSRTEQ